MEKSVLKNYCFVVWLILFLFKDHNGLLKYIFFSSEILYINDT